MSPPFLILSIHPQTIPHPAIYPCQPSMRGLHRATLTSPPKHFRKVRGESRDVVPRGIARIYMYIGGTG